MPTNQANNRGDEEQPWLNPEVERAIAEVRNNQGMTCFRLFKACDKFDESNGRLLLDRHNAEYVVSFLAQTPHITSLFLNCNICREDGAMAVMAEFFGKHNEHITKTTFHGNVDLVDIHLRDYRIVDRPDYGGGDDGSCLECFSHALQNSSALVALSFVCIDFAIPENARSLQRILLDKTNVVKLTFKGKCALDPAVLLQGLSTLCSWAALPTRHVTKQWKKC